MLTSSLLSNSINAKSETTWAKPPSTWNGETARKISAFPNTILISDRGHSWTNFGDLFSLNYLVNPDIRYFLTSTPPDVEKLRQVLKTPQKNILIFRPSRELLSAFDRLKIPLKLFFLQGELWKIKN